MRILTIFAKIRIVMESQILKYAFFIVISCFSKTWAQQTDFPIQAVEELSQVWAAHYKETFQPFNISQDFDALPKIWPTIAPQNNIKQLQSIENYYNLKAAAYRADAGISWNTNTQQNFSPQPGEDNLFFRSKIASGVEWDFLSNGLMENEHKARAIENQKQIELLSLQESKTRTISFENRNSIIYFFNQEKIKALKSKEKLLEEQIKILERLVENKTLLLPVLLEAYKSKIEINGLLQTYGSYNASVRNWIDSTYFSSTSLPPLFDINPKALKTLCGQHDISDRQILLAEETERLQYNWMNDVKLSGNIRYNYFDMIGAQDNRGYISMGIQANIPIKIFHRDYQNAQHIELQKDKWKVKEESDAKWSEVSQLFYEFRYKLKQYSILEAQKKLVIQQLKQAENQKQYSPEYFLPVEAIQNLVEYWDVVIEQLDLHQQLYLKLGEIRSFVPQENVLRFTRVWSPESPIFNYNQEATIQEKQVGLFVWSKSWVDKKPQEVVQQIFNWQVDKVYLSPSSDPTDKSTFEEVVQLLSQKNIQVELLIGKNKWLFNSISQNIDSLFQLYGKLPISGLHLDIEPHAMDGFKENEKQYFELYQRRIQESHQACSKYKWTLGVSIPLFYDEIVLENLNQTVDEVVLMAYETKGPESIIRRSQEELKIFGDKTSIALRAKDYETKLLMKSDFEAILLQLPSQKIAVHDFETYLPLNP